MTGTFITLFCANVFKRPERHLNLKYIFSQLG